MITITIKRFDNKLLSITKDGNTLYQGEPTDYTIVYNEEVPVTEATSQPDQK